MKRLLTIVTAVLALSLPQGRAVTTPIIGFVTLNLQQDTNFLGFALQPVLELQTTFNISATDRTHINLTASGLTLTNDQYNTITAPTHWIEITTSGANEGFTSAITDTLATANELVLQTAIPATVANASTLKIWKLWTLASAFGATNTAGLTGASTPDVADLVLIPSGPTTFNQYFYSTGGAQGIGWRKVGGSTTDCSAVTVPFAQGAAVRARSSKSIIITGMVKPGKTFVTLQTGRNYVANLCPVNAGGTLASTEGRTLGNSGLYTGLATGLSGGTASEGTATGGADLVLLWNGTSTAAGTGYTQYFYSTGGFYGTGWRVIGGGSADQAAVPLPDGAFIIQRRGPALALQLNQGAF
jgi:hypothetical protein